jgi:cell division protein FtsL
MAKSSSIHQKSLGGGAKRWLPMWVIAAMVVMAIGTVWLRLSIVRTTYEIDQVDRQMRALQQAREQMDIKITALRSPRRLELIARTQFGLSPPKAEQIIHMPDRLPANAIHRGAAVSP